MRSSELLIKTIRSPGEPAKAGEPTASPWTQVRPLEEEIASATIQGGAAAASAVGLAYLVAQAWPRQDALGLAALVVYGASMFVAFMASALYHGVQHRRVKPILQKIDHCTIFLFIAGTYTPVALLPLRHHDGVALLAAIWSLAVAGIVIRLRNEPLFRRIAIPLYILMGWLGIGWSAPLYRTVGTVPIVLMIAGVISYTSGLLFYRWRRRPFSNSMWHLCVVAGGTCLFIAITHFLPG
jgi:hemolysin III